MVGSLGGFREEGTGFRVQERGDRVQDVGFWGQGRE
jgi:hypothetical protein